MDGTAFADVRKADVVYGQTVDARGLAVAQCPSIDAEYAMVVGAAPCTSAATAKPHADRVHHEDHDRRGCSDAVEDGLLSLDSPVTVSAAAAAVGESSAGLQRATS
ncbi:MAG: hypothetical protein ACLTMP_10635 [Eggerthella lenta]